MSCGPGCSFYVTFLMPNLLWLLSAVPVYALPHPSSRSCGRTARTGDGIGHRQAQRATTDTRLPTVSTVGTPCGEAFTQNCTFKTQATSMKTQETTRLQTLCFLVERPSLGLTLESTTQTVLNTSSSVPLPAFSTMLFTLAACGGWESRSRLQESKSRKKGRLYRWVSHRSSHRPSNSLF